MVADNDADIDRMEGHITTKPNEAQREDQKTEERGAVRDKASKLRRQIIRQMIHQKTLERTLQEQSHKIARMTADKDPTGH